MTTDTATDATVKARRLTRLRTRTPVEIDTVAAELDAQFFRLTAHIAANLESIHDAVGDRRAPRGFPERKPYALTDAEAIAKLTEMVAAGSVDYQRDRVSRLLANVDALPEALRANRHQAERLETEYQRRPWSRFIQVEHMHSGYWCVGGTVRLRSVRNWRPEYSGMDESEAIAELAANAHTLCTHCFPNAPVVKPTEAPGMCANKTYDPDKPQRRGYAYGNWATCKACGARAPLTKIGNLRKHKRPDADAATAE